MRILLAGAICGLALVSARSAFAQQPSAITVIPQPVKVVEHAGRFVLTGRTAVWSDVPAAAIGRQFARYVEPATGFVLPVRSGGAASAGGIQFRIDPALKRLGPEGYLLDVRPTRIVARAPEAAGLFYAVQTIRQLLPPEIFREAPVGEVKWTVPAVTIEDMPRFGWRGAHLDAGRHFMPKEFVKKYIDLLALHKLNTFHWHLTEDQGWRLEIKQYPKLTEVGAWRKETIVGRNRRDAQAQYDGKRHGGFYTQDDAREIVAYARARFVTVVPEIEMPGHAVAAIAAYPSLGNFGDSVAPWARWGVSEHILSPSDNTVAFLEDVLTEVL